MSGSFWDVDMGHFGTPGMPVRNAVARISKPPESHSMSTDTHTDEKNNDSVPDKSDFNMEQDTMADIATLITHDTMSILEEFPLVEQCLREESADKLEHHFKTAMSILGDLQGPLDEAKDNADAARFLKTIEHLKMQDKPVRTIIGVAGNTGSGKSSVINAILEEEMLVPTNCMRACTAVVTELSYNYSDELAALYRAEIEFISIEDWKKELSQLYEDLLDSRGDVVRDSTNTETEAGVAWAKIKAVYPQQTKEALARTNAETLAKTNDVRAVLGRKHTIIDTDPQSFHGKMQKFIDSSEKESQKRNRGEKKRMELWPLIKVVRIFTKADALATGAVIVDLPGVHDSNAARAAVADKYIEKCDSLWIVAPITRAVDDKTAQNLMGQSFKLQLKYDDKYSNVTFICSKTDDILILEAAKSLKLEEIAACQDDMKQIQSGLKNSSSTFERLSNQMNELELETDNLQMKIDDWQRVADSLDDNVTDKAPSVVPQKRGNPTHQATRRKLRRRTLGEPDSSDDELNAAEAQEPDEADGLEQKPWTKEQVRAQIDRLRSEKEQAEILEENLALELKPVRRAYREQMKKFTSLETQLKSLCIQGRNRYSKAAIQLDFARGIKELDQEASMRDNDDSFDPENDIRDYDQVAKTLPVYCVSSRAYQKLQGRLQIDENIQGFPDAADTGIPQLQKHVRELTESGRVVHYCRFLEDFSHLLNYLSLWSKDHSGEVKLSEGEKRDEVTRVLGELKTLCKALNTVSLSTANDCRNVLTHRLYGRFDAAIEVASEAAIRTAEAWFAPKSAGGFPWNTFRATCIRDGAFRSKSNGYRDLNDELVLPLKHALSTAWERVFKRKIPDTLDLFPPASQHLLEKFHTGVKGRIEAKTPFTSINALIINMRTHTQKMRTTLELFRDKMTSLQMEASREFTPTIAHTMADAYERCRVETGNKCYERMKEIINKHIMEHRNSMFREATNSVRIKLATICDELEHQLLTNVDATITDLKSQYQHVIIGKDLAEVSTAARDKISGILSRTDTMFQIPVSNDKQPFSAKKESDSAA